jgi:hypothetical protein
VTQSRVLTATGFVHTLLHISLSRTIGFMGLLSTLRGDRGAAHEFREHKSHVGSAKQTTHAILARMVRVRPSSWSVATTTPMFPGTGTRGREARR